MGFYDFFWGKWRTWVGAKKRPDDERLLPIIPIETLNIADDLEPTFPLELLLEAVPLSLKASSTSRDAWKEQIRMAVNKILDPSGWATESPVSVTIFYFPDGPMNGDIDNIVKPILDALMPRIYVNDAQVERVWVQKFESERSFRIDNPTVKLAAAIDAEPPIVYIRVDNEISSDR
jgi:crossover junction endodeoxyribonuclease RusA